MALFYVYALFDHTGTVRYIGKGRGSRWSQHIKDKRAPKLFIAETIRRIGDLPAVKVRDHMTEHDAYAVEQALIKAIGRFPNGPLVNKTDKGSGPNSEQVARWHAGRSTEERSASAKKSRATFVATTPPEVVSAVYRQNALSLGRDALSNRMRAMRNSETEDERVKRARDAGRASSASRTPEQRQALSAIARAAYMANTTHEQRQAMNARTGLMQSTPEQLASYGKRGAEKANSLRTPEQRSALARKAALAGAAKRRNKIQDGMFD